MSARLKNWPIKSRRPPANLTPLRFWNWAKQDYQVLAAGNSEVSIRASRRAGELLGGNNWRKGWQSEIK